MSVTYPKANTVTIGYDPTEDRMFLILYLQDRQYQKSLHIKKAAGYAAEVYG